jgi:adenosine deaminase
MYPATQAALIMSVDRRMSNLDVAECVSLAIEMKKRGRRVVGIDVCGDPRKGDMRSFTQHLSRAKGAGLGLTVRIAEVCDVHSVVCDSMMTFRFVAPREYN